MRRFLSSGWFPFFVCIVLAAGTAGAYALLQPDGEAVGNAEIVRWVSVGAWAAGPVAALVSLLGIGLLNVVRRMLRLRRVNVLHPVVILCGTVPWLVCGWTLAGEPPFTPIARAVAPFIGRPLLWGALLATLCTAVLSLPLFFPRKK